MSDYLKLVIFLHPQKYFRPKIEFFKVAQLARRSGLCYVQYFLKCPKITNFGAGTTIFECTVVIIRWTSYQIFPFTELTLLNFYYTGISPNFLVTTSNFDAIQSGVVCCGIFVTHLHSTNKLVTRAARIARVPLAFNTLRQSDACFCSDGVVFVAALKFEGVECDGKQGVSETVKIRYLKNRNRNKSAKNLGAILDIRVKKTAILLTPMYRRQTNPVVLPISTSSHKHNNQTDTFLRPPSSPIFQCKLRYSTVDSTSKVPQWF